MKILPDYLIEMMPALEEALEELRLSVIDHAYELLKCLDVDELSSDTIRRKLELYDLKIDNMTEEWLPNGKFYRMYPEIKHNRTRLNSLKSVVCSGGQFEGLWSNEFIKEAEHNYNKIRTLRHYSVQSEYDGYFYVSGNVSRISVSGSDLVEDSTLTALSTDILLGQAMPAGYTYLYVPWPRPAYPTDAGYFYNVNMLNADRLHYAYDCDTTDSYDESKPASLNYDWENGTDTPWRTPYWFDYHYMGDTNHTDPIETQLETDNRYAGTWPIHEKGEYGNYNEDGDWELCNPEDAHFYRLDSSCSELSNSNAIFPTKCYIRSSNRTTAPNSSQIFIPRVLDLDSNEEIFTIDYNNIDDITKQDLSNNGETPGPYRWDHLFDKGLQIIQEMGHIKTYKPIWSESSPIFAMMQSNFNSGLHPEEVAEHSFYNWFDLKQQKNIITPEESTIRYNNPSISEITHTSYDRPTGAYIPSNNIIVYTRAANDSQGENKQLSSDTSSNGLYNLGENTIAEYDPINQYILTSLFNIENDDILEIKDSSKYIEGDPDTNKLYLNKNSVDGTGYCYASFITSSIHTLWFSSDKKNADIGSVFALYNNVGANELYLYSNPVGLSYNILGVYDENDAQLDSSDVNIELTVENNNGNYAYLLLGRISSVIEIYASLEYNFNSQWKLAEDAEDASYVSSAGNDYYVFKSFSNYHIGGSAKMYINLNIDDTEDFSLPLQVVNSSAYLDYVTVTVDNTPYSFQQVYSWDTLDLSLSNGDHEIVIDFNKDSAGYNGNDCGYVAIPKAYIDLGKTSKDLQKSKVHHKNAAYVKFTVSKSNITPPVMNPVEIEVLDPDNNRISAQYAEDLGIIDVGFGYISLSEFFELGYNFAPPIPVGIRYGVITTTGNSTEVVDQGNTGYGNIINFSTLVETNTTQHGIIPGPSRMYSSVGSYTYIPGTLSKVKSEYYWMYQFNNGNVLGNLYIPDYYESDLIMTGSNPTPPYPGETVPSSEIDDASINVNGSITNLYNAGVTCQIGMYSSKPEFYTGINTSVTEQQRLNTAFICKPGSLPTWTAKTLFDLPGDLYYIDVNNYIVWNTSHILYDLLVGKTVTIYYDAT